MFVELINYGHFADRKGRCKGKVVYASLFGVGAPEALVIGVVALLVFGPKGLAEVSLIWVYTTVALVSFSCLQEFWMPLPVQFKLDVLCMPTCINYDYYDKFKNLEWPPILLIHSISHF